MVAVHPMDHHHAAVQTQALLMTAPTPAPPWPLLQHALEATPTPAVPLPPTLGRLVDRYHTWLPPTWRPNRRIRFPNGIYILVYHSIVDPEDRSLWEQCYRKGETTKDKFKKQLEFILQSMTPIALSALPALWARGRPDRPYCAITFDDGFVNNLTHAHPIISELGLRPTIFVNSEFAKKKQNFFRVLAAVLIHHGHARHLAANLRRQAPQHPWPEDDPGLFNELKKHYIVNVVEEVTEATYREFLGDPADLNIHLDRDGVAELMRHGWEIGNHTRAHRLLSQQNQEEITHAIEGNADDWRQEAIPLIDFIAYPVGRAQDAGPELWHWMQQRPQWHGMFANGGVNFSLQRTEWLRFSLGDRTEPQELEPMIHQQIRRTLAALQHCR
ncbi:MAG: polysaccharide deacetylase family protein [Magnetococcales bacterium]|nr:polysaccharide deacetylase family protein [Magnetococcales bacterium]